MKIHRIEDLRKELEVLKEGSKKVWCVSVPTHKFPTTSEYHCHKVFETRDEALEYVLKWYEDIPEENRTEKLTKDVNELIAGKNRQLAGKPDLYPETEYMAKNGMHSYQVKISYCIFRC